MPPEPFVVRESSFGDLSVSELYDIIKLRVDVFVVEQGCAYRELDDRDHEPGTRHLWFEDRQGPVAYLRVLDEHDGTCRVGRVVTRADVRGQGFAGALLTAALASTPRPVRISAQAHLHGWYGQFGFTVSGPGFDEDGIPHLPMTLG